MRALILIICIAMTASCDKEENNSNPESYNIDVNFQIFLHNEQGQNLLNPDINGSYVHSEINLYSDSLLSKNISDSFLQSSNGNFFLDLYGGGNKEINRGENKIKCGTQYLQLNSLTTDTIYSESIYKGESILLNKVIYNSKEVYNLGDNRAIIVTKE